MNLLSMIFSAFMALVAAGGGIYTVVIYLSGSPVAGWTTTMLLLSAGLSGLFFILTIAGTILVEKVLVHRFPTTKEQLQSYDFDTESTGLTPVQKKGLKIAGIAELIFFIIMLLLSLPVFGDTAILADETGSITNSGAPFTQGIVFTVTLALMIPGIAYGFGIGRYKNDKDLWADISQGFSEMGNYVFMCFFISIFTNFFSVSKIGTIIAIAGADGLAAIGFTGVPLMIGLMIVSCIVDLFIGSASAKWAILAPVYVPMMMLLGYDPAVTQVVYRIGDSICNPLSPLFTYMPVIISYAQRYKKDAGIGTIIANMLPFSVTFAIFWIIQVIVWVALDLPLGPGGGIYL